MTEQRRRRARMDNMLADIIDFNGDRDDLYREIGRFIFEYSQLEAQLHLLFRSLLGIHRDHQHIMAAGFDFARLLTALKAAAVIANEGKTDTKFEDIINDCRKVNDHRIVVVHGRWSSTYGGDRATQVDRNNMRPKAFFEYEGELDGWSDKIAKLRAAISASSVAEKAGKKKRRARKMPASKA